MPVRTRLRKADSPSAAGERARWSGSSARSCCPLGSRPVAYTAVAVRCLTRERAAAPALDRYRPLLVLAVGDAVRTALCHAVDRARPPAEQRLAHCQGASFPSRHTATALLATGLATDAAPEAAGAVAALVGLSRLALRVHWPSDVVGGWAFGYGWLAASEMTRRAVAHHGATGVGTRPRHPACSLT
ncbi:phosphatase PAP2 family protein [Streptomyces sp. NPDC018610]|uniref:phosphatase PAP2 family protein n=1 Tax=Streptomyces sp. NPDC018610 TaxID=3365049 RepID=UPI0037A9BE17